MVTKPPWINVPIGISHHTYILIKPLCLGKKENFYCLVGDGKAQKGDALLKP